MANGASISNFTRPAYDMAQFFSTSADGFEGKAEVVITRVAEDAADRMKEIIDSGGVNKTKKGGARIGETGDMRAAVMSGQDVGATNGRITGGFGFSDSAPFYTKFQERGTGSNGPKGRTGSGGFTGIPAMLAYAEAQVQAINQFEKLMDSTHWFASSKIL